MKRIILYVLFLMFLFFLSSCDAEEAPDILSDNEALKGVPDILSGNEALVGASDISSDSIALEEASEILSDNEALEGASEILSDNVALEEVLDILPDPEVAYGVADRIIYEDLQQVEEDATIIIEAVARKKLGQKVSTHYDYEFQKELPGAGYTKWEMEVNKVYKGDVKAEDKLVLLQDYYIWTYSDGKKQLVSTTALKPAVKSKEYLMFLKYDDRNKGYWPVCDYEGMFAIPSDEIRDKVQAETLEQSDLEVYNYETLDYLVPIYSEVIQKYFN